MGGYERIDEAAAARPLPTVCGTYMTLRGSHSLSCARTAQAPLERKKKAEPKFRLLSRAIALAYWIRRVYLWMKVPT